MTNQAAAREWLANAPWLLQRALTATYNFTAQQVVSIMALASLAYTQASTDPNAWPVLVATIGADLASNLFWQGAFGSLSEDQIRDQVQQALDASHISEIAQPGEIQELAAKILADSDLIKRAVDENQSVILQRLRELDQTYAILLPEMRSQLDDILAAVNARPDRVEIAARFDRIERHLVGKYQETIPHSLPNPPADFTGREHQVDQILDQLHRDRGAAISGLAGMGGVGKTALALVVAHRLSPDYPDGQIYIDLKGTSRPPLSTTETMCQVIRAFQPDVDLHQDTPAELAARYRTLLTGKCALLLFDNAFDSGQVKPLLPPESNAILITSRRIFTLPGLPQPLALDVMSEAEARALLLAICPRIGDRAADTASLCGRLPLALRIAASTLAEHADLTVEQYIERLEDRRTRVAQLKLSSDPDLDVEAAFQVSYDMLEAASQERWRALAVFPAPFDLSAVAAVWVIDIAATSDTLGELVRASLLTYDKISQRYRLHDLLAGFADALLDDTERYRNQSRHAYHYFQVVRHADQLYLQGHAALADGVRLFRFELPNIAAGQVWAASNLDRDPQAARMCSAFADQAASCMSLALPPSAFLAWLEPALAAARRLGDRWAESKHLGYLGNYHLQIGEVRQAIVYYQQALPITREVGDLRGKSADLGNLGLAYVALGDPSQAISYFLDAITISRAVFDRRSEGSDLINLGMAYANLGDSKKAITYYDQARTIAREIGHRRLMGNALGNMGNAYAELKEVRLAIRCLKQGLAISRTIGDRRGESTRLGNLGSVYFDKGKSRTAIKRYEQALAIAHDIGDRLGEANHCGNLGCAYALLDKAHRAVRYFEQTLALARHIGNRRTECDTLRNLAAAYVDLNDVPQAIGHYEQAIPIAREVGDRASLASLSHNVGVLYMKHTQRLSDAESSFRTAIENAPSDSQSYSALALVLRIQDREREAIPFLDTGARLNPLNANTHLALACVHKRLGNAVASQQHASTARPLINPKADYTLACLESICGNAQAALDHLRRAADHKSFSHDLAWQDWDLE